MTAVSAFKFWMMHELARLAIGALVLLVVGAVFVGLQVYVDLQERRAKRRRERQ